MTFITRFAPSPTGPLHLGHAYSALLAYDMAQQQGGRFLLRIEDTDQDRSRAAWERQIYDDLGWLGLTWETPVLRQSDNSARYDAALATLETLGVLYPCSCKRSDIRAALSAPQEGDPPVPVYPGTCRARTMRDRKPGDALRLNMARALDLVASQTLSFTDKGDVHPGQHHLNSLWMMSNVGDAVLARKNLGTASYVLSAVVDDANQHISHVIRGADLFETTFLQVMLQALLDIPTPVYVHHRLIRDDSGKRLAKRDDARAILKYRQDGLGPQDLRKLAGL